MLALLLIVFGASVAAHAAEPRSAPQSAEMREGLAARPDPTRGEDLYAPCGACHGVDGRGVPDGSVPAIAGQNLPVILKQLVDYRHGKRWDLQMEHASRMKHLASAQDLADVASFVASLPRGFSPGVGTGEYLNVGARIYFRRCESCHGPLGEGDAARGVPRLAGQHYAYLYRQFFDVVEGRRPGMSTIHQRLMTALDREQIIGIADYLARTSIELSRVPQQ